MSIKEDNERKKEYLRRYHKAEMEVQRLDIELQELRRITSLKPIAYHRIPQGGAGAGDLSNFAVKAEKIKKKLYKARYKRIKVFKEIRDRIGSLDSENQKTVLTYRYIKWMEWEEIAEKMKYGRRNVTKIHGKALENLKID